MRDVTLGILTNVLLKLQLFGLDERRVVFIHSLLRQRCNKNAKGCELD